MNYTPEVIRWIGFQADLILIICLLGVLGLLYLLKYGEDNVFELKERKQKHFVKKALRSDDNMMKYIKIMVKNEYRNQKTKEFSLKDNSQQRDYIEDICKALADTQETVDFETCQTACIDMIDKMKAMIRNYYRDSKYEKAADCTIAYLSICEANLVAIEYGINWKRILEKFFHIVFLSVREYSDRGKSPKKVIDNLQKKDTSQKKSLQWYQSLKEDLELLQKYYGKYKFDTNGTLYFPGGIHK